MRRSDKLLVISLAAAALYWMLTIVIPGIASPLIAAYYWLLDFSVLIGYQGALVVSFIGNATILFPFPYIGVPFILGGLTDSITDAFVFDPWLVGLVSGAGAALGEMTGYLLGFAGGSLIDEDQRTNFRDFALQYPRLTPFVLWFLAATPIPDDVLVVPLGAAKYPWWKVFLPQIIGKSMFLAAIAWAGRAGLSWIGDLLGGMDPIGPFTKSIEVAGFILVIFAVYLLVRVDWSGLSGKMMRQFGAQRV
ncbi:MAG: VTT domain-containing protein [Candidatus Thorarchaeota archaeon]